MSGPLRSITGLARRLAARWWPQLAAVAAACAVVSTTVTGGLGVGDAIRGGLRELAVGRLGRIDVAVFGDVPFRRGLAAEIAAAAAGQRLACTPALVLPATLDAVGDPGVASRATLLACDDPAALGFVPAPPPLEEGGLLVNRPLAAALGVEVGDTVVLRLPKRSVVPADVPLGRRSAETTGRRLKVSGVLPAAGLGAFSLRPTVAAEPLAVLALETAQAILRDGDVANVVFVAGSGTAAVTEAAVAAVVKPRLADHGLTLERMESSGGKAMLRLASRRLLLGPEVDRAAAAVLGAEGGRATLVFLANEIAPFETAGAAARARVPYSTVLGIDATTLPGGRLVDASGAPLDVPLDDEIIIDRWLADDLAAQGRPVAAGDLLTITAFMPETIHGRVAERTERLRVAGIAEMEGAAVDRTLVPEIEGITDEDSIADWDPPFPFDADRVRTVPPHDEDDRFWKRYRATPKAFVSLAAARRLAASRFGQSTAWHVPADDAGLLASRLEAAIDPLQAGFRVVAVRAEAEAAARGSTPFGGLFLALSSFVVLAGLLLVWLLFSLLVAAQAPTIGTLAAVGFPPRRLATLLVLVAGGAAVLGAAAGAIIGPVWTRLLVAVLGRTWDRDIVAGSAAVFAPRGVSALVPLIGGAATLVLAVAALATAAVRAGGTPPLVLLRGGRRAGLRDGRRGVGVGRPSWLIASVGATAAVAAVGLAAAGRRATAEAAVGLFFAAGFAALAALLAAVRVGLASHDRRALRSLPRLAARMLSARPGRAFSIASIVACGQFLVVAVTAFAVRPPADPTDRRSPTGGWTELVSFGEPTSIDPSDADTRATLGLTAAHERVVAACRIALVRSSAGDDASCTNLYATLRPTVLGVGPAFVERGGFRFVGHEPLDAASSGNPWRLVERLDWEGDDALPAILDQATAQWGLKLGGVGSRFTLADEAGRPVACRIVALLEPGILQGRVIVGERGFQRLFPSVSGYALALVDASGVEPTLRGSVPAAIRAAWVDAGVSLESTVDRVRRLQAVQNTFLTGFQSLGLLGLLLGTAGVAAVQLQGVVERLAGLSVLRAVGFSPLRVRGLVTLETLTTVGAGVVAGTLAGCLAIWPALAEGTARVPTVWIAAAGGLTLAAAAAAGWLATARTAIPERPTA